MLLCLPEILPILSLFPIENSKESELAVFIKKLNSQVNRLTTLIGNLLDVTKITGGELQPCPPLVADRERLGQVITNLLSNAVKYSPRAEQVIIRSSFELGDAPVQPRISVSVQDFGNGISEKDQAVIFERFVRVKDQNTNTIPGLGLGLYISGNIIKRHGGSISVISKLGKGSTFSFSLPVGPLKKIGAGGR